MVLSDCPKARQVLHRSDQLNNERLNVYAGKMNSSSESWASAMAVWSYKKSISDARSDEQWRRAVSVLIEQLPAHIPMIRACAALPLTEVRCIGG